jgi:hypothetical protein
MIATIIVVTLAIIFIPFEDNTARNNPIRINTVTIRAGKKASLNTFVAIMGAAMPSTRNISGIQISLAGDIELFFIQASKDILSPDFILL